MDFPTKLVHSANQLYQPIVFRLANPEDEKRLHALFDEGKIEEVVDPLEESIEDLFKIDFPFVAPGSPEYHKTHQKYWQRFIADTPSHQVGVWVYFPWRHAVVHLPDAAEYLKLRTSRNKFLITEEEQQQFYNARIGVAGLSVGSSVVNAIVLSGGGGHLKIADPDTLSITNLNRLQASVCDLGRNKAIASARRVYEINPFQDLEIFPKGLSPEIMDEFMADLDLFIEEMDDIKLKIDSRFAARERRIPVIMATDNGDNTIVDIERFDLDPNYPLFHGRVPEEILKNTPPKPSLGEKVRLADSIVGQDVTPRMQHSLTQVGSKLPAWPQLGNAATLSGAAISYVARRILTGEAMPSGRYEVNFDALIDPHYHTDEAKHDRARKKDEFVTGFKLLFGGDHE